ncbi:MAG: FAD-dependent oxidoreductase [Chloroflexota bacterium]
MTHSDTFPVLVIGAGLAGLSAASHLASKGMTPLVIDADSLWQGGRLSGGDPVQFEYKGQCWSFKPDHGVHALWGGYVNMKAMIARFTDAKLQMSAGEEWINRWGRTVRRIEAGNAVRSGWIPAPFHYLQLLFNPQIWSNIQLWDFLSLPGFLASMLLTVGVDPIKEKIAWDGLTMSDYFLGWTPNLRATFEGLGVNLLAAPKDDISLASFVAGLRFYTMLRNDSWQMSYMPADSHTALIHPLMQHIQAHGGAVEGGITAKSLHREDDGWCVRVEDSAKQGFRTIRAENIILAMNAPATQRLLCNSPATASEAQKMTFPTGLRNGVVRLWFDKEPRAGTQGGMFTGDFAPDNFFWLHRLYDDYAEWHNETGGSVIEIHYYEDELLEQPDRNLIVESVTEVQRAFPELQNSFVHATVRRNSKVHTKFRVPTADSLHVNTAWDGIYACGDWVGHDTPSLWMERATTTGIAAANMILEASGKETFELLYPPAPSIVARFLGLLVRGGRWLLRPLLGLLTAFLRRRKDKQV